MAPVHVLFSLLTILLVGESTQTLLGLGARTQKQQHKQQQQSLQAAATSTGQQQQQGGLRASASASSSAKVGAECKVNKSCDGCVQGCTGGLCGPSGLKAAYCNPIL